MIADLGNDVYAGSAFQLRLYIRDRLLTKNVIFYSLALKKVSARHPSSWCVSQRALLRDVQSALWETVDKHSLMRDPSCVKRFHTANTKRLHLCSLQKSLSRPSGGESPSRWLPRLSQRFPLTAFHETCFWASRLVPMEEGSAQLRQAPGLREMGTAAATETSARPACSPSLSFLH